MSRDVNIGAYLPATDGKKREFQGINAGESPEMSLTWDGIDRVFVNQFLLTADEYGISRWEKMFRIMANPAAEDLEFRRQRLLNRMQMKVPFTFRFLLQRLDDMIGPGKYNAWLGRGDWNYTLGSWALGREAFREPEYTLHIEAAVSDIHWYHEVQVYINSIKPANIVYVLSPLVAGGIVMSESIRAALRRWNYRLGSWGLGGKPFLTDTAEEPAGWNYALGKWALGKKPFGNEPVMEVVKLPESSSITSLFLGLHAQYTAAEIETVRLNGSYIITDIKKHAEAGVTTLRYVVTPASSLGEITRIELLNACSPKTA